MPSKRDLLAHLTRNELLDYYELNIDDRWVKDQLMEALASSRRARLTRRRAPANGPDSPHMEH